MFSSIQYKMHSLKTLKCTKVHHRLYAHTHTCKYTLKHTSAYTHEHAYMCVCAHTHTNTHTHTHKSIHTHTHKEKEKTQQTQTHTHLYTKQQQKQHTHTHTHTHTHMQFVIHPSIQGYSLEQKHSPPPTDLFQFLWSTAGDQHPATTQKQNLLVSW